MDDIKQLRGIAREETSVGKMACISFVFVGFYGAPADGR
jgi:hypothetical protein